MSMVIFYKAKPKLREDYSLDVFPVCKQHRKIFMPYPQWKILWNDAAIANDYPADLEEDRKRRVSPIKAKSASYRGVNTATNLITRVDQCNDNWVIVPRFKDGVFWLAKVESQYTVWPGNSPWLDPLRTILQNDGFNVPRFVYECLADAAQGWNTSDWKEFSVLRLPRWFLYQLLSRGSLGEIKSRPYDVALPSPVTIASDIYYGKSGALGPLPPTPNLTPAQLMVRLVERLSPKVFELLCIEILGIVQPNSWWFHFGGAGDGGADGIGFDRSNGNPIAILQVKWKTDDSVIQLNSLLPLHLFRLIGNPPNTNGTTLVTHYGPSDIANMLLKHSKSLSRTFKELLGI